jgi:hypothetical protein
VDNLKHPSHTLPDSVQYPPRRQRASQRPLLLFDLFAQRKTPSCSFGSALHPSLQRTTMTSADSSPSIPPPLGVGSQWQTTRSPRVMRTCLHTYACRIYAHDLPYRYMTLEIVDPSSVMGRLICDFCSSGQCFASDFLPTQPHDYAVAVRLTVPPVGPAEDFHLQAGAPCRAHNRKQARGLSPSAPWGMRWCYPSRV